MGREECEMGGDGCDDECKCMYGWYFDENESWSSRSVSCHSKCGDEIVVGSEECDMSVGCDNMTCNCSLGWKKNEDVYVDGCVEVCGDGLVVGREECDSTSGCSDIYCVCEQDHPFNKLSGLCSYCGNGIVDENEECDNNDEHCDNGTCKCSRGYLLKEDKKRGGGVMICVKLKNGNDDNDIIIIFVVISLIIIIIIFVVVVVVVLILKKKQTNDDDYIEMDDDVYEVEMGRGKKGRLEISNEVYESGMTIVYKGVVDGKKDVVVKIMKMWGTKLDSSQEREMELMRRLKSDYIVMYYGVSVVEGRLGIVMDAADQEQRRVPVVHERLNRQPDEQKQIGEICGEPHLPQLLPVGGGGLFSGGTLSDAWALAGACFQK